jgi:hypothetical protein
MADVTNKVNLRGINELDIITAIPVTAAVANGVTGVTLPTTGTGPIVLENSPTVATPNLTGNTVITSGNALTFSGTGIVNARDINSIDISGNVPTHEGQVLISQPGNTTAVWADPFVQGVYPPGTNVTTGGLAGGPINPVLIGGKGADGLLHDISTDNSGVVNVNATLVGSSSVTQGTTPWTIAGDSASGAANAGNPVKISGVFNTSQPTVTTGQTVDAQATARGAQIVATGADTFNTTVNAPLPAGTNVIGHVITDSGSTTAVTQATAANLNATVVGTGTFAVQPSLMPNRVATGTITSTESIVISAAGVGSLRWNILGTWTGIIVFEVSIDGTNWVNLGAQPTPLLNQSSSGAITSSTTANGQWISTAAGTNSVRIRGNTVTSGTATVHIEAGPGVAFQAVIPIADGQIDPNNSTTTPLGANAVFTGTSVDMAPFTSLRLALFTDQVSAIGGGQLQFSEDNTNWDFTYPFTILSTALSAKIVFGRIARYFRLIYQNGATPQGIMRCQVILQRSVEQVNHTLIGGTAIQDSDSATLTRSVVVGKAATQGDYVNVKVSPSGSIQVVSEGSVLGDVVTSSKRSQYDVDFSTSDATDATIITNTTSGSGTITQVGGQGIFATGTAAAGEAKGVTVQKLLYRPGSDIFAEFSAGFTTPTDANTAHDFQRIGFYDANNGFYVGYEGTGFNVSTRTGAVDTHIPLASFNLDPLTGVSTSQFTRIGIPEAVNFTKLNLYRIRFSWFGAANIFFDIFTPDGGWLPFHVIRYPNTAVVPSIATANLPMTIDAFKTASDATNLIIITDSWAAGVNESAIRMNDPIVNSTLAIPTRSVIAGIVDGTAAYGNVRLSNQNALQIAGSGSTSVAAAVWTSATAINTVIPIVTNNFNYNTVAVNLVGTSTITAGAVTFEVSIDNVNWVALAGVNVNTQTTFNGIFTLTVGTTAFLFNITGFNYFRERLSTAITGTGSVTSSFNIQGLASPNVSSTINTGTVHVSGDQGAPNSLANAWPIEITDGTNGPAAIKAASTAAVAADAALVVAISPNNPTFTGSAPGATAALSFSAVDSTAYENSHIIKASPGTFYGVTGFNSKASSQFLQVHNTTTVPADTAVPVLLIFCPANTNFSYDSGRFGKFFSTGMTICNSSTGPTKTIGSADCWFNVLFS